MAVLERSKADLEVACIPQVCSTCARVTKCIGSCPSRMRLRIPWVIHGSPHLEEGEICRCSQQRELTCIKVWAPR